MGTQSFRAPHRAARRFRVTEWPVLLAVVVVLLGTASFSYLSQASQTTIFHRLDILAMLLNTPIPYLAPLLISALAALGLANRLSSRFVIYTRTRVSLRNYLLRGVGRSAALVGGVFGSYTLLCFVVAFFVLPELGLVEFADPSWLNGFTRAELEHAMHQRYSFAWLLAYGDFVYGLGLSLWVGAATAVYAALAQVLVIVVRRRLLGLLLPFAIATAQTVVVALLGIPEFGLWYVVFPFGLAASPVLVTVSPIVALALLAGALWMWVLRRPERFETLG